MPRPAAARAKSATERKDLAFEVAGEHLSLQSCGALWWEEASVLVVSDLHLEKGSSYAAAGQMLPPYDTRATLQRVAALVDELEPTTVISLGDSFHDRRARPRMAQDDVLLGRRLTSATGWIWIRGQHDSTTRGSSGGSRGGGGPSGGIGCPRGPPTGRGRRETSGRLHPCARVAGK